METISERLKPDVVNSNNMSDKLREVLERKSVIDHISHTEVIKDEPDLAVQNKLDPSRSDLVIPKTESVTPDVIVPKLEPITPDLLGSDVFNEVEITSEVEVCTSEDTSKATVKEEPLEVAENAILDEGRSMDSVSTADQDVSNEIPGTTHDSSSCETILNCDKQNVLTSTVSDDNSQSSVSKQSTDGEEDVSSVKCNETQPIERTAKTEAVVITTTTTTTTTTVSTQRVTTVDGVIKSIRTKESVSSEISRTIK